MEEIQTIHVPHLATEEPEPVDQQAIEVIRVSNPSGPYFSEEMRRSDSLRLQAIVERSIRSGNAVRVDFQELRHSGYLVEEIIFELQPILNVERSTRSGYAVRVPLQELAATIRILEHHINWLRRYPNSIAATFIITFVFIHG